MSNVRREPNTRYKVGRVVSEYDLERFHDELPERWLGEAESGEPVSLRTLADHLNTAILRRAMERAGANPLEGEAENAYRLLTDDDVSAGVRTQQRNRLEREGVDVDRLESDFVTHQAVHTYLTEALGVSKDRNDGSDPAEKHEQRIQRLRSRTEAVTDNSLGELREAGTLELGSYNVVVDIQVYCQDCGTQYEVSQLFRDGGCDCEAV
ncbi:MAG: rod-determining factor RdfA [Salinirussus sp.]